MPTTKAKTKTAPAKKAPAKASGLIPLVVTTAEKGVFFGLGKKTAAKSIDLKEAQMCVYWSTSVRGVLGLAGKGPDRQCKITPAAPSMLVHNVTAVMEASDEAAAAWRLAPWG